MSAADTPTPACTPLEFLKRHWSDGPHSLNGRRSLASDFVYLEMFDSAEALLDTALSLEGCVWFGVNATPGATYRGGDDDVSEAITLFVDLDWDDPEGHVAEDLPTQEELRAVVEAFPIDPTAIVDTGGGYQVYWRLAEAVDRDTFDRGQDLVTAAFEAKGLHVEGTAASQVLRVPGTMNHKYDPPRPVTVVRWRPRLGMAVLPTVDTFESRFGHLLEVEEDDEPTVEPSTLDAMFAKATGGPITDYNNDHTVESELLAAEWKKNKKFWSRPGRSTLGQSAKVWKDDRGEALLIYSTSPALKKLRSIGKATKGGKSEIVLCTAFDLYAVREHDGDVVAAWQALNRAREKQAAAELMAWAVGA